MLSSLTFKQENTVNDSPMAELLKYLNNTFDYAATGKKSIINHKKDVEDVHFTSVSSHSDSDNDNDENLESQIDDDSEGDQLSQDESNVASPRSDISVDDEFSSTTRNFEIIMVRDVKVGAKVITFIILLNCEILEKTHVVTTPGSEFGPASEGFVRASAFGHRDNMLEACRRCLPLVLTIRLELGTDKSKMTRKQSKNGQARTRESEEYKKKPKNQSRSQKSQASVKSSQRKVNHWSTKVNKSHNIPF
ncbi:LL-diaminopimelate aminotransferase, chloroplastic [Tanacetum coccineum]